MSTRSVRLTEAGKRLYAAVRPALAEVRAAVAALGELSDAARGTLRLLVGTAADPVLAGPVLASFLAEHPRVTLDLVVSDAGGDIVAEGYDAGIQLGESSKTLRISRAMDSARLPSVLFDVRSIGTMRVQCVADYHRRSRILGTPQPTTPWLHADCPSTSATFWAPKLERIS